MPETWSKFILEVIKLFNFVRVEKLIGSSMECTQSNYILN